MKLVICLSSKNEVIKRKLEVSLSFIHSFIHYILSTGCQALYHRRCWREQNRHGPYFLVLVLQSERQILIKQLLNKYN